MVLPKAALMGKGSGCLDAALKEAAKDTLTVELPLLAKAGPQASAARQLLLDHAMQTKDQDNEVLLKRIKQRMDKWVWRLVFAPCMHHGRFEALLPLAWHAMPLLKAGRISEATPTWYKKLGPTAAPSMHALMAGLLHY